jgi:TRAP-type C4-dicarboxylate transport system permease small subunit
MRMAEIDRQSNLQAPVARGPLFYLGACGLLVVMIVETLAVLGRHLGLPLLGAIEIIQAAILVSACAAVVLATVNSAHAAVHLLTDRLAAKSKRRLAQFTALLSALFFVGLTVGAVWLALDYWHAHEESDLLHIPFRPLRTLVAIAVASIACIFVYRAVHELPGDKPGGKQ